MQQWWRWEIAKFEKEHENSETKAVEKVQESGKNASHSIETISSADLDNLINVYNEKVKEYASKGEHYACTESGSYLAQMYDLEDDLSSLREDMGIL